MLVSTSQKGGKIMDVFENPNSYPKTLSEYMKRMDDFIYSTKKKYESELNQKIEKIKKQNIFDLKMIYEKLVDDFKIKSESGCYAESTFRAYRAYIVYGLALRLIDINNYNIDDVDVDNGFDEYFVQDLYLKTLSVLFVLDKDKPMRTAELKAKYFERTFYNYLIREHDRKIEANIKIGEFDRLVVAFVDANLVVGLRPIEWFSVGFCCALKGPKLIMIIANGKATHGRANGLYRYLILDDLKTEDIEKINLFWNLLNRYVKRVSAKSSESKLVLTWDEKQTFIRILGTRLRLRYEEFLKLKGKVLNNDLERPTLYSTRHQCIANAKVKGVDKFIIAGAFGHAGKDTASRYYGKKWRGHSGFNIMPTLDTIEHVNGSHEFVKTLLANNIETPYYFDLNMAKEFNTDYYNDELKSGLVID